MGPVTWLPYRAEAHKFYTHYSVQWSIAANHGGGYQYRLCPAAEALTEASRAVMFLELSVLRRQSQILTPPFKQTL